LALQAVRPVSGRSQLVAACGELGTEALDLGERHGQLVTVGLGLLEHGWFGLTR
jgi:hypothetical protein